MMGPSGVGGNPAHFGGVSFVPEGRGQGYNKLNTANVGPNGSMESLDSTQSLTLSNLSLGSTTSTGMFNGIFSLYIYYYTCLKTIAPS